jgi:type II pantothenate kinase
VSGTLGIDVGATLCKLAVLDGGLCTEHHPSRDLDVVRTRVEALAPARVVATGGGADRLGDAIAGVTIGHASEFEAWARGAPIVAAAEGVTLPGRYLLVSLGTGTSILAVGDGRVERVGGTALGGGTVVGLGRLLVGATSFEDVTALAAQGNRHSVDLMVGDVYRGTVSSVASELTASSFAKLDSTAPPDVAHALMGLVAENVVLIAGALARGAGVETIVYCGSTLTENPAMRDIVGEITSFFGHRPTFLARGAYCGAVGAAALRA